MPVHKRFISAFRSIITTGSPLSAAGSFIFPGQARRPSVGGQPIPISTRNIIPIALPGRQPRPGKTSSGKGTAVGPCKPGSRRFADGHCHSTTKAAEFHTSEALMGRYGAALVPDLEMREVRTCLPGMVLGNDGLCYNKGQVPNKSREHPRGTRPLGTPGEMASLRKAAAFGRRMEKTVKRMEKIGVLKKPARRSAPRHKFGHSQRPSTSIVNVE